MVHRCFLRSYHGGDVAGVALLVLGVRVGGEGAGLLAVGAAGRGSLGGNDGDTSGKSSTRDGITAGNTLGHHGDASTGLHQEMSRKEHRDRKRVNFLRH